MKLGLPEFTYEDLHDPHGLARLHQAFVTRLEADDAALAERYVAYRDSAGRTLEGPVESELLVAVSRHVSRFLASLFGVEAELAALERRALADRVIFDFKKRFMARRVFGRTAPEGATEQDFPALDAQAGALLGQIKPEALGGADPELALADAIVALLDVDKAYEAAAKGGELEPEAAAVAARLRQVVAGTATLAALAEGTEAEAPAGDQRLIQNTLSLLERWCHARAVHPAGRAAIAGWVSYKLPKKTDYDHLVHIERPRADLPESIVGPASHLRRRDGFGLTDDRGTPRQALSEIDYCIICHERSKDSCSKGLHDKGAPAPGADVPPFKKNPLGVSLHGCPLEEHISEMHKARGDGDAIGALALVSINNPMAPGTGHRICNDCMKGCIYQKQDPVNIPFVETHVLTDVLKMPYGFEIWSLLTRWNPLNAARPYALPYNGKKVLVVGLGPAGYTLCHHLVNEGFGVVGVDGLKVEPLPERLLREPVREWASMCDALDRRILSGFGGVSEYGITVRWDKNFLTTLYVNLARRPNLAIHGGVRFGGTLDVEDAWQLGFDHVALAAGAGRPTIIDLKNNLIRGVRKASDFLMALQLTGAFKRDSMAALQVRLPAIVIGGGLTGIDTATELAAYYPVQVELMLDRWEQLVETFGLEAESVFRPEELEVLGEFLEHGRAVRAERERAASAGEAPDFVALVRGWGGVSLAYRKDMQSSPAYRLNHEEIEKALEEGIYFVEGMNPIEAVPDAHGAVRAVKFERQAKVDRWWKGTGEIVELPARTVCVAAGTAPNVTVERENPGRFALDAWNQYFQAHHAHREPDGTLRLEPAHLYQDLSGPAGFFTSHLSADKTRCVSFYGDNHPQYAGSVVKAMASAKDGYSRVAQLFEAELATLDPAAQPARDGEWRDFSERLGGELTATVVEVKRLTPTIVEVICKAPLAARKFQPGQFYRLQAFESRAPMVDGTRLVPEGLALTGAWVDAEQGLLSLIVLEMGASSRLCATLQPGEPVVCMGPTGTPTEIPEGESVVLVGGGLGNAVLFSIAKALKERGNRVLYFAGYRKTSDLFKREDIEAATDQVIWACDEAPGIAAERPQDRTFVGNIVQAMVAFATGELGEAVVPLPEADRLIAIGSDGMMAAVKAARHSVLAPYLKRDHVAIGSINSPMQCMMKEICAQCLQRHVGPDGKETLVFTCTNQDQHLDQVDFPFLNARLKANSVQETVANLWLTRCLLHADVPRV